MHFTYLNELNKQQKEAATQIEGPLRIIAGAGSGKTKTLITRVAYMIDNGIKPEHILLITFTNNAAQNMIDRAAKLSNPACKEITACTIHSLCAKLLREYGRYVGVNEQFVIISPNEEVDAVKLIETQLHYRNLKSFPSGKELVTLFSTEVNMQISIEDLLNYSWAEYLDYAYEIVNIKENYKKYKNEKVLMSYDDLLVKTYELMQIKEIRDLISSHYQYVMVDEYQDTNRIQEQIILLLCERRRNLAVVGDDYQSIYAFRGADVSNLVDFQKRVPGCKTVILTTNYRSTSQIVNLANSVMDNCADFGIKKQMDSFCGKGKQNVYQLDFEDNKEEAKYIAKDIIKSLKNGVSPEEIAILGRGGNDSNLIEIILKRENIPYRKLGGVKFLDHECVQDVLAHCKVACNPYNELGWYRVLDMMPNVGDVWSHKILKDLKTPFFMSEEKYGKKSFYPYFKRINELFDTVRKMPDLNNQIDIIIKYYLAMESEKIKNAKTDEVHRKELYALLEMEKEVLMSLYEVATQYSTMLEFLDAILLDATNTSEENTHMVTISTVHSAKGLEWDYVYLLDCVNTVYPNPRLDDTKFKEDESLRCLYVAMTRAKQFLYISTPREIRSKQAKISKFLKSSKDKFEKKEISSAPKEKIYLSVPYARKDEAKSMGAKWDPQMKKWYCFSTDIQCNKLTQIF